jgi:membrane protein YdbS with pleckstrin-like domain
LPDESKTIRIKPSFIPYVWKGLTLMILGVIVYVAVSAIPLPLPLPSPAFGALVSYVGPALIALGLLGVFVGAIRRNMFTYLISDRDVVVQKQLLRRSVRRIPFAAISDLQVSQTPIGRLAGYGNIAPVTKSGYGLVRGMDRAENVVQEMINVPKPDKVADLIMSKASVSPEPRSG